MFSDCKILINPFLAIRPSGELNLVLFRQGAKSFHGELCESRHVVPPVWGAEVMAGSPIPPFSCRIIGHADIIRQ